MAETLGFSAASILSWVRSGLISPRRDARGFFVFSFQDIALLRTARDLVASDVSPRRVRRALQALQERLPADRPLSAVQLDALGGQVLVRDGAHSWDPDSGQIQLALDDGAGGSTSDSGRGFLPATTPIHTDPPPSADALYELALTLETDDTPRAMDAYRQALAVDATHADAHLNLGRLLHEQGDLVGAEGHYRAAAAADPTNGRCLFNLGVALEDQGRPAAAVEAYEGALDLDPDLAVAHFNLSRLFEAARRPADALRHLSSYKRLLRRDATGG